MKKIILLSVLLISSIQFAYAADTANIKIKIAGAINDNRYFMCMQNVGCLSIRAANKGKTYPVNQAVEVNGIYLVNMKNNRLFPQALPASCNTTVKPQQTLTITGTLAKGNNDSARVNELRCTVS